MHLQLLCLSVWISVAAAMLRQPLRHPNNEHKNGETQSADWGQEYGKAWNKDVMKPGMDNFDKNLARDATSKFDEKHPLPGAPAGSPAATPKVAAATAGPMKVTGLDAHEAMHKDGETQASDWGAEYGMKEGHFNQDPIKPGMDKFDTSIVRHGASPAAAPAR